jgi:transcription elongation factor Elf1
MSDVAKCEVFDVAIPPFITHVFRCPCCKNETTVLSPLSFISMERTECENCGQEFLIENDIAHVLTS